MKARHEFLNEDDFFEYLRIYLASKAMTGILSDNKSNYWIDAETVSTQSFKYADELINKIKTK